MNFKNFLLIAALFAMARSGLASVNIFIQPQNQSVPLGSNAVFTASTTTTSGETITGYTWLVSTNSSGPFSTVAGATGPLLTIANAQFSNSGFYFVRVNYLSGGNPGIAVSTAVTLSVQDQARVTTQPVSITRSAGGTASFTVTAEGEAPLGFQWRFKGTKLNNNARISGANSASLTVSNLSANDAGNYDVIVTNSYSSATSHVAVLTVLLPPAITVAPSNTTVVVGNTATFSVAATGSAPLGYRWRKNGVNLPIGGRFSGVTNDTLVITGTLTNDTGFYSVFITNSVGSTNVGATLTVLSPPEFTNATNVFGRQGLSLNFKLTATGSAPIVFGSEELPNGLSLNSTNGQISGTPLVAGIFPVTVFASNAASNTAEIVTFTITTGVPGIISPLTAQAKQGELFTYSIFASNNPVSFSTTELPIGLSLDSTNGVISGSPLTNGVFTIAIGASNQFGADSKDLILTIDSSVPVITSPLSVNGKQGQSFSYTIEANNDPVSFSASGLPIGLNFDAVSGVISGAPIEQGIFPVLIGASNQFGADQQILLLDLATSAPVITSPLVVSATEGGNFSYTIQASNSPESFNAVGLPLGLVLNPTTGVISGTAAMGGTNDVVISARNSWGVGSSTLQIQIAYEPLTNLFITDVTAIYSTPYLLDFAFSLRDSLDPATSRPVVRPLRDIQVVCMEGNTNTDTITPVGSETAVIVSRGLTSNAKQLKTFFVMDYTFSMFETNATGTNAIGPMEAAVENLINQEPGTAQFAVNEFHADFVEPSLVVSNFTSDKTQLIGDIQAIRENFVQGNHAGSRMYDALEQAINQFGPANKDEQRYLIVMSDGHDDASALSAEKTNQSVAQYIVSLATNAGVQLYCVGFGSHPETNVLLTLATETGGRYFAAVDSSQIAAQFTLLLKDLNSQYFLRWATLQRGPAFQPMFQVTVGTNTASYNTNFPTEIDDPDSTNTPPDKKFVKIDNSTSPPTTYELSDLAPDFNPADWAGDVKVGQLNLVPDAGTNFSSITLRAFYVPRYVREIRLHYRANYPCVPHLVTSDENILNGWSLIETNDGAGGSWLTVTSPDPFNLFSSIPYGIRGDLISFQFPPHSVPQTNDAFSLLEIDNSIYTNLPPTGQSFVLNTNGFVTFYDVTPPHGTPVPWLIANGFTSDFANAELSDPNGNGMPVWQEYLAGLDPNDPDSTFGITVIGAAQPGLPNQITFTTVVGKTYRVESAVTLGYWTVLEDGIAGTGGEVSVFDRRELSGVSTMFYRIAVY